MNELVSVLLNSKFLPHFWYQLSNASIAEWNIILIKDIDNFHRVAMLRSYVTTVSLVGITCGAPIGALLTSQIGWQM
jgi:predicted MFS family arabinose efflux permease